MPTMTPTTEAAHIPEVWIDEVLAAVEFSFEFTPRVNRSWRYVGYGDIYHVPRIGNIGSQTKVVGTPWTPTAVVDNEQTLVIDKHDVAGFKMEDITKVLTRTDLRAHYQKKIGYALGRNLEINLAACVQSFSQAVGTLGVEVDYETLLEARELIIRGGTPDLNNTTWLLSPGAITGLMKQDIFINALYKPGNRTVTSATIGEILGAPVVESLLTRAPAAGQSESAIFRKEAIALMQAMEPSIVNQYIIEDLAWVVAGHQIYGYVNVERYGEAPGNNVPQDDWAVRINTIA